MKHENLYEALEHFLNETIRLSRRNLNLTGFASKGRKINNTKDLSNGLGGWVREKNGRITTQFTSKEKYAAFINDGVNGLEVKHGSKFSHKKKFANIGAMVDYIKGSKVRLHKTFINKAGQKVSKAVSKTPKNVWQAAVGMAYNVARYGKKPTHFFDDAVEETTKKLPIELEQAFAKDLEILSFKSLTRNKDIKVTIT